MSGIDYFALMRGITELHVRELGIASPAPASEDALGWQGGGEHPINSSPLNKFKEVTPMRDESQKSGLRLANGCGEKRPDNTHIDMNLTYENPAICVRQGGVEGLPNEAPPFDGTTLDRLFDAVAVCEERSRR